MWVYLDSSALLKRAFDERESAELSAACERHRSAGDVLVSSTLSWIEVSRAAMRRWQAGYDDVADGVADALAGVAERDIDAEVVSLSRRLAPDHLRSLDAIHVASALLLDAEMLITYDDRMADAARLNGVRVSAPGR